MTDYPIRTLLLAAASLAAADCQTAVDLRTQAKSVDFSAAASTRPMQMGSALPASCAPGQFFFLTTAPAGSNIYGCNPANVWSLEGNGLAVTPDSANKILSSTGVAIQWQALGGDISGAPAAVAVNKLQGRALAGAAPSDGQVLKWNAAQNAWQPAPGQAGNYSYVFVSQLSLTIPGTVHQFGTGNLIVDCYDSGTPPRRVEADSIKINPSTFDVTISFSTAQTGYCVVNGAGTPGGGPGGGAITPVGGDLAGNTASATVTGLQNRPVAATAPSSGQALAWNGSAWAPANFGGGGAVSSVFGRTGAVTAQTGDYSFNQISGSAAASQLPAAGGDLTGTLAAATVQAIQGRAVANTAPGGGQALVWNGSTWAPATVTGGGGAAMAYQLQDLVVTWTSNTVLTVGANCSPSAPCNIRFGNQTFNITSTATATLSGSGTGTAYFYVTSAGILTVGHNLTVACSAGCIQQPGVTSFPANVVPLWSWTANGGLWDSSGGRDQRAFLSSSTLASGAGIILSAPNTIAVDNGVIPTYLMNSTSLTFPGISSGACAADQTLAVTGANPGDAVAPGWPVLPAGVLGMMFISSANNVTVRLCNFSGSPVSGSTLTYRATLVRNY